MKQPKTFTVARWSQSWVELLILYALITVAGAHLFEMSWVSAMASAPLAMLAILLGVFAFVQVSWLFMVGLEKLGSAVGLSKSPLV